MASTPDRGLISRILVRKSVEQVQRETETSALKRTLGPWNLVFLGIGCIIGAGIFVRTGNAAALHAGPAVLISFLVAGVVCALAGLCYAELSSTLPVSGSAYTYSYTTIGEFAAWIMGGLLLLEYGLAASVVAVGWSGYVVSLLGDYGLVIPPELTGPYGHALIRDGAAVLAADGSAVMTVFNLPAFLICMLLAGLLVIGVSESAKVNNIIVAIKGTVIIAFIVIVGWYVIQHFDALKGNWDPFIPEATGKDGEFGWGGILRAASIVFFAYIGFEAVSTAGQEAKNPKRDMPFGIIGSLLICTILYILVSIVMTLMVDYKLLNVPDPVAVAVDALGPSWGWFAKTVKIGAIIGLTSVILVLMYGQTRIFYTMARDGLLPRVFATVHAKFKTPWINTILVGLITAIAAGFFDINTLGDMTSVGTLAAFGIVCLSVMWLRTTHPQLPRGFRVPMYPILPVLGIIACFGLIFTVEKRVLIFFAWYALASVILYFIYGIRNSRLQKGLGSLD
ncbi:MAG: amino acid permease [Chiayiivirga sp.]|jgi:APA family basic amino acid/polyamine antiporter|uniref:amino acid permease n=1 Tax=Chiayiivirga sp. TaxID=2041042 RepID=UPI0025BC5362|nr:amino acid permease [Chiayiivirga sp.]MCI1709454.1 amino acid permease [Chiayiivirga sp.]MCI1730258.1 amino acid permease [Chiayiivirga sp.]